MSNFVSLRLFYGCCCTEYSPTLPLLPFARIKFRKKIIFMRVRGVGINGWIIFRKRRTSSLRWAVSHSNVLVITQCIMQGKGCSPPAAHMPSTGWTRMYACDCICVCVCVSVCACTCAPIPFVCKHRKYTVYKSLHIVLYQTIFPFHLLEISWDFPHPLYCFRYYMYLLLFLS